MKTQTRIAIVLFISNVIIILLFGGAIYYFLENYSYNDFYKRLNTRAGIAAQYNLQSDRLGAAALKKLREQHLEKLPKEREYLFEIVTVTDIAKAAKMQGLNENFLKNTLERGEANLKKGDTFYSGVTYNTNNRKFIVVVSADNYFASHHLSFLASVIWAGMGLIAFITITLSIYFSKRVFDPLKKIIMGVREISTENIHLRLDESQSNNEISELISTFNDLLNRLETAFETQKNFISNASHEFGTPLTSIMGEAEVALKKDRSTSEYKEALTNIVVQAERLDQITRSLLFLARTGYGGKNIKFETLRIDEVIWTAKILMDNLNPQNKIYLDLALLPEDPFKLKITGNKDLLQLAIANLLNNASKYSQNKPVSIRIVATNAEVIVNIEDQGVGIPENEIQYIYDPFFRASNTGNFEGYGIGLPLSRNIVRVHNGKLLVSSTINKGTQVELRFPLVKIF